MTLCLLFIDNIDTGGACDRKNEEIKNACQTAKIPTHEENGTECMCERCVERRMGRNEKRCQRSLK